ncbi:hypothetical protein C1631_006910 [Chryseobacterium phosphatilyticum]|uniref:Uncharacterized protein n=1 Tax=Chryseobacterium phosphatilyticum TaxID=475075 RepID=A0A316XER4_9FLAO|nr:hypothetical protein [Chryseobacterium phosphatilyticum]PWN72322.1 hypothetical protein C1631_006910 [Chryseobacterium phosphatilyticum]
MEKRYIQLLLSVAGAGGAWMGRNEYQQYKALLEPEKVDPDSRLGAMIATKDFTRDQVGYGVYPSIRLIHLLFGNVGEQKIGEVFNRPDVQKALRKIRTHESHKFVGSIEESYWKGERKKGENIFDELMILFGANVNADTRACIQEWAATIRERNPLS